MPKQKRQAKISYTYDRLGKQKLAQVYRLLVSDNNTNTVSNDYSFSESIEQTEYENSSNLYKGIQRPTERE
jgi:hypothetical protein